MQIQAVDANTSTTGVKCVVYGRSGVGKTRLVLTVPRPIIVSAERGLLSVRGNNLPMLPEIGTLAELIKVHDWCLNNPAARQFDTVFIDSISEIAEVVLRGEKVNNRDGRKAHDNTNNLMINNVFRAFRDLPNKHVVMIAKERSDTNEQNNITEIKPSMPNGALREALPHYFDFVFRLTHGMHAQTQQPWTALQTNVSATVWAKDRSGKLNFWEPPSLGEIFQKVTQ